MEINLDIPNRMIPHWQNWFGAWAMNPPEMQALQESLRRLDLRAHLETLAADPAILESVGTGEIQNINGVAFLSLAGPMMKHRASFGGGCSTVEAKRMIGLAKRDPSIKGLMLKIDSPGGTVAGTMELADAIRNFGKPTRAFCCDLTASAAYWVASQCDEVIANEMALVGSIGTYTFVTDASKAFDDAGIKVHVIKAGEFKGAGVLGTPVTDEQLAETQSLITKINKLFVRAVSSGREMSEKDTQALADGRVHLGIDAMALGLVDNVQTFEDAFNEFEESLTPGSGSGASVQSSAEGEKPVADQKETVATVTPNLLKERFPKSSADWRLKMLEEGATIEACIESYAAIQEARAEAAEEALETEKRKASKPGTRPLATAGVSRRTLAADDMDDDETDEEEGGDATADWDTAVASAMKRTGGNRQQAMSIANRENPGLREAMLTEHNAAQGRPFAV